MLGTLGPLGFSAGLLGVTPPPFTPPSIHPPTGLSPPTA